MLAEPSSEDQHATDRMCSALRGGAGGVAAGRQVWEPEPVTAALLAHQGGWDEILMVLVPIVIFAALLVVANRRANSSDGARDGTVPPDGDTGNGDGRGRSDRGARSGRAGGPPDPGGHRQPRRGPPPR